MIAQHPTARRHTEGGDDESRRLACYAGRDDTLDDRPSAVASTRTAGHSSVFRYPWTWLDDHGARLAFSMWRGTPLVVAAVYTTCLETCPRTIVKLRRLYDEFA